ncbi:hypothetical protein [Bradyrhizobium pachyrhizi]|uniref:hypothetical protein n=1 Tax=Bradyrhizobium pachyrhizi TaxID=280333 RepID=UPI00067C937C|nr:hypothetical protein [Bradyrhizobium pachyrhizi]
MDNIPADWFVDHDGQALILDPAKVDRLISAAKLCYEEMRHTVAPRDSFTDALDALDAALYPSASEK